MTKIFFVGAGPGDPKYITLRGYELLQEADVVIWAGSLVNPALLKYCHKDCQIYDSAKMNLDEIIQVMKEGAIQDKVVVRLQTGDLSLFGSIREQIERLKEEGIGFETIPGVSSFLGAAASLGVEFTVPEVSQSLIITRMAGRTPVPEKESLREMARHQTSMAIFLSISGIEEVAKELILGGYPKKTPVTVIYKATWQDEKVCRGTLEDIAMKVKEAKIKKTALILVGAFLGEEYHYSKLYHAHFTHEYRKGLGEEKS